MQVEKLSGRRLGRYEIREVLGTSAMSAIYHAYQTDLERHVAVKVLSPELTQQPDYIAQFTQEARMVAALEHPHIVPIYDYGLLEGISYLVTRLLTGGTLAQRLDQRLIDAGPLPALQETSHLIKQLASALDYAHSRGVIHRDVKSGNVMFDGQGRAYLVDFGIARLIHKNSALTERGIAFGTPSHMAPEQWSKEEITPATDQYALGILTYLLVTGVLPFTATAPHGFMYKHLNETPTPPHTLRDGVPESVTIVLERVLAKQPEDRYRTVSAFADAFAHAVEGLSGEPTDYFTFSLTPATMPIAAVPDGAQHSEIEPAPAPLTPEPLVLPTPVPVEAIDPTPIQMRQPARKPNYITWMLVGAGIGMLLLIVFAAAGLLALTSLVNPGEGEQPPIPTNTFSVIPTLTPIMSATALIPIPALTSIAQVNPTMGSVPVSGLTAANASEVVQVASFLNEAVPVRCIAFDPTGNILASGNGDSTIWLWNINTGAVQTILSGHEGIVYGLEYSPDGALLASASGDGTIILWDSRSGAIVNTLRGHTGEVRSVSFSPDGTRLASAGEDGSVRLWNVPTGTQQAILVGHAQRVLSVEFSPDGTSLASGGLDTNVILWDAATGIQRATFTGHQGEVRAVAFNPDGTTLASASTDNTIRVWNTRDGASLFVLPEHGRDVFSVDFSPDGSLLATGGRDNTVRLWNVHTGEHIIALSGHSGWVFDVAFSPDGAQLASAGGDGSVRVWAIR